MVSAQEPENSFELRKGETVKRRFISLGALLAFLLIWPFLCQGSQPAEGGNYLSPGFLQLIKERPYLKIAVLPITNFSLNADIAYHFRMRLKESLKAKGYSVLDTDLVDQRLINIGITHAGQLGLLTLEELKTNIGADLFLSGAVEQASKKHGVAYNSYVYTCSLKLQNTSGENLWYTLQERVAKRRFAIDPINAVADIFLVEFGGNSKQAVKALADKMMDKFPDGPAEVILGDALLEQAIEIKTSKN